MKNIILMILTFKSVDKTLWCYCSDETSLAEYLNSNYYVPLRIFQNELSFQPVLTWKDKSLWDSSLQVQASLLAAWDVSQGRHQQFRPQNSILMNQCSHNRSGSHGLQIKFVWVLCFSSPQKDIFPVITSLHPKSKHGTLLISQSQFSSWKTKTNSREFSQDSCTLDMFTSWNNWMPRSKK